MHERGILRLDTGREIRVEVVTTSNDGREMVVRKTTDEPSTPVSNLLAVIGAHLASARRHPAGTTDRLRAADRERPC